MILSTYVVYIHLKIQKSSTILGYFSLKRLEYKKTSDRSESTPEQLWMRVEKNLEKEENNIAEVRRLDTLSFTSSKEYLW